MKPIMCYSESQFKSVYCPRKFNKISLHHSESTSVLSRSVAFDLNDVSKDIEEIKPPVFNPASSTPPETKSPKQIHREKKVTPIPRQVRFIIFE